MGLIAFDSSWETRLKFFKKQNEGINEWRTIRSRRTRRKGQRGTTQLWACLLRNWTLRRWLVPPAILVTFGGFEVACGRGSQVWIPGEEQLHSLDSIERSLFSLFHEGIFECELTCSKDWSTLVTDYPRSHILEMSDPWSIFPKIINGFLKDICTQATVSRSVMRANGPKLVLWCKCWVPAFKVYSHPAPTPVLFLLVKANRSSICKSTRKSVLLSFLCQFLPKNMTSELFECRVLLSQQEQLWQWCQL